MSQYWNKKAKFCPDLSGLYNPHGNYRSLNKTHVVTIALRNSTLDEYVEDKYIQKVKTYCMKLMEQIREDLGENMKIYIIYQIENDKTFSQDIYKRLKTDFDVEFVDEQLTLNSASVYYG